MDDRQEPPISLAELDARHDALLREIDALDDRIRDVLREHLPSKRTSATAPGEGSAPICHVAPITDQPGCTAAATCDGPSVLTC